MSAIRLAGAAVGAARGTLAVPGDKSISHRVMLLGAVASGPLEAEGFLMSEDCLATRRAVEALGARVEMLPGGALRVCRRSRSLACGIRWISATPARASG
jgi:3-phosphoshikimate 1-carboxyvinyltransferase